MMSITPIAAAAGLFVAMALGSLPQSVLAAPATAPAAEASASTPKRVRTVEGITEYVLPNGLQVLLAPDASKPTVTVNITYRVGSRHENYGETGMAHLLEHLVFKGTPTHQGVWGEFTKRGMRFNGTTWDDRTNYFASFSADDANLKWYLGWQADAMVNSFIAKKDLDSEMTVVRNEMEMGENSPGGMLYQRTLSAMYDWHNYSNSTIGARSDVENVDISRLQAFYKTYYQPDNATLVVSGKFDPAKTLQWISEAYAKVPKPTRVLPRLYTLDPVQDGERQVTLRRTGGTPMVLAAYHVPAGASADQPAFELIDRIMSDSPAGRLHKRLVDAGLAASVGAGTRALHDPGYTTFSAQLNAGQSLDAARDVLLKTVESIAAEPITNEEVERAKAQWLKDWELGFSNSERVGVAISEYIAQGDWRLYFLARDRVKAMTAADVNRAAQASLKASNRTLGLYIPTEKPDRAPAPQAVDVAKALESFKPVEQIAQAEAFEATPKNIAARTQIIEIAPGFKAALLPKGTRGDVVTAQLQLNLGDERSLMGQEAVADLLPAMFMMGSKRLTRQQIDDKLTALKAQVGFGGGATRLGANVTTTKANLPQVIELVAELLREPAFPQAGFDEIKSQTIAGIEAQATEPGTLVGVALARYGNPYPKGDVRYASTVEESLADVKAVTLDQVKAFYTRFVGAQSAQFAAVGAMDAAAVQAALTKGFAGWKAKEPYTRVPMPLVERAAKRVEVLTPDKQNAMLSGSIPLQLKELDPDHAALAVGNMIFGQSGDSRLMTRIRHKEGLSYGVGSGLRLSAHEPNSMVGIQAIYAPQNRTKVETAFKEEFERAAKDGFTAEEVAKAKAGLLASRQMSRAQDGAVAGYLMGALELNRDLLVAQQLDDAIAAVTPEQVNAAWRKHVRADKLVYGVGGDFKGQ